MDAFAITGTVLISSSIIYAFYLLQKNIKEAKISNHPDEQNVDEMHIHSIFTKSDQSPKQKLIQLIDNTKHTLDVAIFTVTEKEIISHLCYATKRGVKVRLLTDKEQTDKIKYQADVIQTLINEGIPVMVNKHSGIMHLKLMISDKITVASGSYNFTKKAEQKNDEVLVFINNKKIALDWSKKYEEMWKDSDNYIPYSQERYQKYA